MPQRLVGLAERESSACERISPQSSLPAGCRKPYDKGEECCLEVNDGSKYRVEE
jgi:hypothetical protein